MRRLRLPSCDCPVVTYQDISSCQHLKNNNNFAKHTNTASHPIVLILSFGEHLHNVHILWRLHVQFGTSLKHRVALGSSPLPATTRGSTVCRMVVNLQLNQTRKNKIWTGWFMMRVVLPSINTQNQNMHINERLRSH